jgi:hypothetical protein
MRDLLVLTAVVALGQAYTPVERERTPESIPQLPPEVRQDLSHRQCLVPRYVGNDGADDWAFVAGHFRSGTSLDYAVVCHIPVRKTQDVLVYSNLNGAWSGEVIARGIFDPSPGADKCEATAGVATPEAIREYAREFAPEELKWLPPLDHEGVEVGICEKASIIHYFSDGRWLELQGGD